MFKINREINICPARSMLTSAYFRGIRAVSLSLLCFIGLRHVTAQETSTQAREEVLRSLSYHLLGSRDPVPTDLGGYQWVALAPAGTLLPSTTGLIGSNDGAFSKDSASEGTRLYDSELRVKDGIALPTLLPISSVYQRLIATAFPIEEANKALKGNGFEKSAWGKILYRQSDRIDDIRGVKYETEKSEMYERYVSYRRLFSMVSNSNDLDSSWRLEPKLSTCKDRQEALSLIEKEWGVFGFRERVDAALALWEIQRTNNPLYNWRILSAGVLKQGGVIPQFSDVETRLFPRPESWYGMGSWSRLTFNESILGSRFSCSVATIEIKRDWLNMEALHTGLIKRKKRVVLNESSEAPIFNSFPEGELRVIPVKLILIRDVTVEGKSPALQGVPFASPLYPHAIQLGGYITQILPNP